MTNDLAAAARRRHPESPLEPAMLNAWWGLVVISVSVWIASLVVWERAETLDEMVSALFIDATSVAIWVGAGAMTLWLVREIGIAQAPEPYRPIDDQQVDGESVPPELPSNGPDMLTADDRDN